MPKGTGLGQLASCMFGSDGGQRVGTMFLTLFWFSFESNFGGSFLDSILNGSEQKSFTALSVVTLNQGLT